MELAIESGEVEGNKCEHEPGGQFEWAKLERIHKNVSVYLEFQVC